MRLLFCCLLLLSITVVHADPETRTGERKRERRPYSEINPEFLSEEKLAQYTPVPVEIDPLGAEGVVPWTVHVTSLNVRSGAATSFAVLGSLPNGTSITGEYNLVQETDEEWLNIVYNESDAWISVTGINRTHPLNQENIAAHGDLPIGKEIVNRWWGIPISYEPSDLAVVPSPYTTGGTAGGFELRQAARDSVVAMIDAARQEGVDFLVSSPYRSGVRQQEIYLRNVANSGLNQRFSAPPGHSEHQLGTTADFTDPSTGGFLRRDSVPHAWLSENGARFGWRQTYLPDNTEETGYIEEPWHWRYLGPKATGWSLH